MKAPAAAQLLLLELQEVDTRLDQHALNQERLPQLALQQQAQAHEKAIQGQLARAQIALSDVQGDLERADNDVQLVRDRAARDQARLDAGTGTAKDLQAVTHELASLARRQAELEEVELEVMERAEAYQTDVSALTAALESARQASEAASAELAASLAELRQQREALSAPRADLVSRIGQPSLVELYERLRAAQGGIGAAVIRDRRCTGCRLEMNPLELQRISSAPADQVHRCDECDRIVVQVAEGS